MFRPSGLLRAALLMLALAVASLSAVAQVTTNQIAVLRAPMG